MRDFILSYDSICLKPKLSKLESRGEASTSTDFCGWTFKLPVVPANMEDVISIDNARWLSFNGFFYIMHRFNDITPKFIRIANDEKWQCISISIGTRGYESDLVEALERKQRIDFITIDVAHAHHDNVKETIKWVRKWCAPTTKLIVGNVATYEGVLYLAGLGVDAIKVGIGGGSICTTKYMTGFHLPTLQSVKEASEALNETLSVDYSHIPIIADGGSKYYGDIAKALTFGATMVMSGGWFASCIDSPAKIVCGKKLYRGSTSYEAKGKRKHIEGRQIELDEGLNYEERMKEIKQALQSSISYAGGNDLSAFNHVQWDVV